VGCNEGGHSEVRRCVVVVVVVVGGMQVAASGRHLSLVRCSAAQRSGECSVQRGA